MKRIGTWFLGASMTSSLLLLAACPSPSIMRQSAGHTFSSELNQCGITVQSDFRRLTAAEYRASVKDLLGVEVTDSNLPPDSVNTLNYDNDATLDHLSDLNADLIYNFADAAVAKANSGAKPIFTCQATGPIVVDPAQPPTGVSVTLQQDGAAPVENHDHRLGVDGSKTVHFVAGYVNFQVTKITLNMSGTPTTSDNVFPHFLVTVNGKQVFEGNIASTQAQNYNIALATPATAAAPLDVSVVLTNNKYESATSDRNIDIMSVALNGPPAGSAIAAGDCKKNAVKSFLTRAFGVPPSDDTVSAYQQILDSESDPIVGQAKMETAILMSPSFVFTLLEFPDGTSDDVKRSYMVLQRASLFLWGSRVASPQALDGIADGELLSDDASIRRLIEAMLPDSRTDRLISNAFNRWLHIESIADLRPDTSAYPKATPDLMLSMRQETEMFVRNNLDSKGKISDLFESNETFVNKGLADLYGIPSQNMTSTFAKVNLPQDQRAGLFTQASVLTQGNPGVTTSPIKRSVYFLRTFECTNLEPPKNVDVSAIASANPPPTGSTVKEALAFHAALGSSCMGCHGIIDPMGIAFEEYDAIGQTRSSYPNNQRVEANDVFSGKTFDGAPDLVRNVLRASHKEDACMTRHLLSYALASSISPNETCSKAMVSAMTPSEATLENLIVTIMTTDAFKALRRE